MYSLVATMDIYAIIDNVLNTDAYQGKTELCEIMKNCGSDKGLGWHNYTTLYDPLLSHLKEKQDVRVFELGIGTNNPNLASSMGVNGVPGASLRGWAEWLPNAQVFGADIDKDILFASDRIKTFYVDQRNAGVIQDMWNSPDMVNESFDLIVDDGLHSFGANDLFLMESHHKLKDGGVYIVEDILPSDRKSFENEIPKYLTLFRQARVVKLPNPANTNDDNNLLVLIK